VFVWDLPTRIFHWGLLVLIVVAWITGEEEGQAAAIHRYAGEAIAGLIVFRVIWGFLGGERARFSDFIAGPTKVIAQISDLFSSKPEKHLGHNPLGSFSVFLLLLTVSGIVVTGLFSSSDGITGPFAGIWGQNLSEIHELLFTVLQALVVIHILGVLVESFKTKDRLVPAMITGWKKRRANERGEDAKRAKLLAFLFAALVSIGVSFWLMSQPMPSTLATDHDRSDEHREYEAQEHDDET
ncbi:cytochrome b/b6 domain-containing protein, partial [Parasphingorhabdus sp.]|uniref:cytochrome b/b6 domain-containing protein n=1 Tax=Parasphingorhabdus sp. TaxID=2709688 RepID=UPI003C7507A4